MMNLEDKSLLCPHCEDFYLHQEEVRVIFRDFEDGPGNQTRSSKDCIDITRISDENIPGRRDVIQIDFTCEICDEKSPEVKTLQIMQHKGSTLVEWL